jgi:hypothetical protein
VRHGGQYVRPSCNKTREMAADDRRAAAAAVGTGAAATVADMVLEACSRLPWAVVVGRPLRVERRRAQWRHEEPLPPRRRRQRGRG